MTSNQKFVVVMVVIVVTALAVNFLILAIGLNGLSQQETPTTTSGVQLGDAPVQIENTLLRGQDRQSLFFVKNYEADAISMNMEPDCYKVNVNPSSGGIAQGDTIEFYANVHEDAPLGLCEGRMVVRLTKTGVGTQYFNILYQFHVLPGHLAEIYSDTTDVLVRQGGEATLFTFKSTGAESYLVNPSWTCLGGQDEAISIQSLSGGIHAGAVREVTVSASKSAPHGLLCDGYVDLTLTGPNPQETYRIQFWIVVRAMAD